MPFPSDIDPDIEITNLLQRELERQTSGLQLIASENFTSPAVMRAVGSVLTNKYSEGYPGKRYYGGNAVVDDVESLAIERAKALFGAEHANVQPHSGANANMCVYQALLEPGDTVLGLSLNHGGHLTHGSPVNASGILYRFVAYGITPGDERIDFDQIRDLALLHRPKLIVAGTTSYPRRLDPEPFRAIADEVGALFMFDAAHVAGLIAGGAHPDPVPFADVVTFTTHKTLRGPRGGCILSTRTHAAAIDKAVFPGWQGGPLEHVIAGKAVAFREAAASELPRLRPPDRAQRVRAGRGTGRRGLPPGVGWYRQPPHGGRSAPVRRRAHGQGSANRTRRGRHHAQQERHPRRPAQPVRDERAPDRHAVGHDAGHDRTGDVADREPGSAARSATATTPTSCSSSAKRSPSCARSSRPMPT